MLRNGFATKKALTLVEVLVVSFIVALLVGLCASAYVNSKAGAKERACAAQLGQLAVAVKLYANDHDGSYPPTTLWMHPEFGDWRTQLKTALATYGAKDNLWWCPRDPGPKTRFGEWGDFSASNYPHGLIYGTTIHGTSLKAAQYQFSDESNVIFLHDHPYETSVVPKVLASVHGDCMNEVYLDGHSKLVRVPQPQ
jgi:type II secretory pathway pseudopilin PulG